MTRSLLGLLLFHALPKGSAQWLPVPPAGYDGYKFGECSAPAHLEMFVDLLCGSCKAAFPTIEEVAALYGPSKLQLSVHTIPAPWHTWAFIVAQSMHVVAASNRSAVLPWLRLVFANQDKFLNDGPYETAAQVGNALDGLAVAGNLLAKGTVLAGLSNITLNFATRISWKFAVTRGVSGTPGFLLNGVALLFADDNGGAWNLTEWQAKIDPVLTPLEAPPPPRRAATGCDADATPCSAGGKAECCAVGDFCVPGVGCRA